MKKKTAVGITAIIPSYNDKKKVFRLLDSLKKSDYPNLEIMVVDNGSLDGILKEGRRKYGRIKWIDAGPINIGQTGAYNLGFAYVNLKNHILMIDSDVVVEKNMVSQLVERLESCQRIGIVTPMILYLEDKNWVNQAGANVDLWTGKVSVGWGDKKSWLEPRQVQNSGTVMLFKNELVKKIGCFEDWFLCYFDPDYCLRAKKAGYEVWYEPKAVCYHDQPKDSDLWRPRILSRAWLLGKNRTLFMRKHGKSLLVYILFLPLVLGYYFFEAWRYKIMPKWFQLVQGTVAGFFHSVNKDLFIPIPRLSK